MAKKKPTNKPTKKPAKAMLHLVKGETDVKWYATRKALRAAHKVWPPQSSGGCELRWDDKTNFVYCENVGCPGSCRLNGVPGGDGKIYFYCTCTNPT